MNESVVVNISRQMLVDDSDFAEVHLTDVVVLPRGMVEEMRDDHVQDGAPRNSNRLYGRVPIPRL